MVIGMIEIEKEYKLYCLNSKIKDLNGRINSIGTEEDTGESLINLEAQLEALTNVLKML